VKGDPVGWSFNVTSVFDRSDRNDRGPATASESSFEFLNRVDSMFGRVRDALRHRISGVLCASCVDSWAVVNFTRRRPALDARSRATKLVIS
jgi:hypothetical protein